MRKYTITSGILSLLFCLSINGQVPLDHLPHCATAPLDQQLQQDYSAYYSEIQAVYNQAVMASQPTAQHRDEQELYIIPVVVHIVWQKEEENISTARIHQQLEVLNEDFQKNNADTINARSEFSAVLGNPNISFELIEIVRVHTDTSFSLNFDWNTLTFEFPDHVKQSALGGSNPRDVNTYLNIWICPIESDQFFGYAYPPHGITNWPSHFLAPSKQVDGVVLNYKTVGRNLAPFIDQEGNEITLNGRTATHEIGHYLGLRHPWGDGGLSTPSCVADDGLIDTPNAAYPSDFECDLTQNSCQDDGLDLPDMIENFMDYSADDCKHGFTQQQSNLMRYVLRKHRSSLRIKKVPIKPNEELLIYPNPTSGIFTIHVNPNANLTYGIKILDMAQRKIQLPIQPNLYNENNHYRIDLSNQPMGVYLVEFATNGRRVFSQRVVVVR